MSRTGKRIWELDALRGLGILVMIWIHFVFDMKEIYGIGNFEYTPGFLLVKDGAGFLFLVLSGVCVTLGSRSVRRGCVVFGAGMLCTAVTWGMSLVGFSRDLIIRFGVLHCLGICMLLWPAFRRLPAWVLAMGGGALIAGGTWLRGVTVRTDWLMALGLHSSSFTSGDYFPLLPYLGWFLLGAALGRWLYAKRETLLPGVNEKILPVRFLTWCGRHSLMIYLLHQPVLCLICMVLAR